MIAKPYHDFIFDTAHRTFKGVSKKYTKVKLAEF